MSESMSHGLSSSNWGGSQSAAAYALNRHGKDGAVFLDPFLHRFIPELSQGRVVLDAGCGAGPWAMLASHTAKQVVAIDINQAMVEAATVTGAREANAIGAKMQCPVSFRQGDVTDLFDFADETFDTVLSINVGCNMTQPGLARHFREMARVLKPEGRMLVTAPNSLDEFFTCGEHATHVVRRKLEAFLGQHPKQSDALEALRGWNDVLRATLTFEGPDTPFQLIPRGGWLAPGTPIYRKIPGLVVPNFFHTRADYDAAARGAKFLCEKSYETTVAKLKADTGNELPKEAKFGEGYYCSPVFFVAIFRKGN